MMRRSVPVLVLAGVLVAAAATLGVLRVSGYTLPWESAACGDPNAVCWTHGKPVYTAIIRRGDAPSSTALSETAVIRMLNTGPDIPHLVATLDPGGLGYVKGIYAAIDTGNGRRTLHPRRLRGGSARYMWDLGRVPDGSVVTIRTPTVTTRGNDITWTQAALYGRLLPDGRPDRAAYVQYDHAPVR